MTPVLSSPQTRKYRGRLLAALPILVLLGPGSTGLGASARGEAERIAAVLALAPGMVVADVGAGDGDWTAGLARGVEPGGLVYTTEVDDELLDTLQRRFAEDPTVVVVDGDQEGTGLAPNCCDAILLRLVYHHFTDPARMRTDLRRALRPGGRLAVVDISPQRHWRQLQDVPERGGHGIEIDDLIAEMAAAGFRLVARHPDWPGDEDRYCVVFTK